MDVAHPQRQNRRPRSRRRRETVASSLRSSLPPNQRHPTPRSLRSSMPPNMKAMIAEIDFKTDEGDNNKPVPLYKKGTDVFYRAPNGLVPARILDVHLDDLLEPYYTILREDGLEKQTDNDHLTLCPEISKSLDENREKRKKRGLCPSCGEVQPHKPGKWRSLIPDTVDKLVSKGIICPKCSTLDAAKKKLGEPIIDGPAGTLHRSSMKLQHPSIQAKNDDVHSKQMKSNPNSVTNRARAMLRRGTSNPRSRRGTFNGAPPPISGSLTTDDPLLKRTVIVGPSDTEDPLTRRGTSNPHSRRGTFSGASPPISAIRRSLTTDDPLLKRTVIGGPSDTEDTLTRRGTSNPRTVASNNDVKRTNEKKIMPKVEGGASIPSINSTGVPVNSMSTSRGTPTFEERPRRKFESGGKRRGDEINENRPIIAPQEHECAVIRALARRNNHSSKKPEDLLRRSQARSITEPDSILASSNEDLKCSTAESVVSTKKKEYDFRCSDSNGDFGFYTGTVAALHMGTFDEKDVPHGRGEMVYDDSKIARGVWSKGILQVKIPQAREKYEPFLLPGYSVGDVGLSDDMMKATAVSVSKLHVNDCAWIRRSDRTWSYAIVKFRSDGDDASITFQVNPRGSTKTIGTAQWAGHVRLSAKHNVHPGYSVGDPGRDEDMIIASQKETVFSASRLRIGDGGFVARSNGAWVYAIVIDRTDGDNAKITFEINHERCTKSIPISQCGRCVRCIKHEHRDISDEEANIMSQLTSSKTKSSRRQGRRVKMDEGYTEKDFGKFLAPDESNKIKQRDTDADQHQQRQTSKSSSFLLEEPQELQQIYKQLDQRNEEGSVLAIYDNCHHDVDNDKKVLTDATGSSLGSSLTALTDKSKESIQIKDQLLMSIIARRRRRATTDGEDSIDGSLTESLQQSWESFKNTRRAKYDKKERKDEKKHFTDEEYSYLTDKSKQSVRTHTRDKLLMSLIAQAAMEDNGDGDTSVDFSLDESLTSLKESFIEWRKQKKSNDVKKKSKDKKKHKDRERKKRKEKEQGRKTYNAFDSKTPWGVEEEGQIKKISPLNRVNPSMIGC